MRGKNRPSLWPAGTGRSPSPGRRSFSKSPFILISFQPLAAQTRPKNENWSHNKWAAILHILRPVTPTAPGVGPVHSQHPRKSCPTVAPTDVLAHGSRLCPDRGTGDPEQPRPLAAAPTWSPDPRAHCDRQSWASNSSRRLLSFASWTIGLEVVTHPADVSEGSAPWQAKHGG